ncbi:tetratricopeptide repeat protein [Rubrivirga sp. IMCC45206]|uniref:tetratricopeptide repeat protein n=1 Tax=Rubrivirga sp. IMCC45206 TaxID=3391614 RepID=UPI003990358D
MRLLSTLIALAVVAAVPARAQATPDRPIDRARSLLASGDTVAAYGVVQAAVRETPRDPDLRRLQIRLRLAGQGTRGMAFGMRSAHVAEAARFLIREVPDDTLALAVLMDDAVLTAARWHDRVWRGSPNTEVGTFMDEVEIRARMSASYFDLDAWNEIVPLLDQSVYARRAHEQAVRHIATWLAVDPAAPRPHRAAVTLAAVTRQWDAALVLASRYRAETGAPEADLLAGLALFRLGRFEEAAGAVDAGLARLPPAERGRHENIRRLLPTDRRAAYDADPAAATAAFWATADPRLLTAFNERRVEHVARVVEADLLLGAGPSGALRPGEARGADTADGQIWVRYGRPPVSRSYRVGGANPVAYRVWDYDGFRFVFEDLDFSGEFRTFSPPAGAFAGPGSRAANDDYVLQEREMARSDPQRSQVVFAQPLEVSALVSRFRAPGGGVEAVVAWGVPSVGRVRSGAFAIASGAVVDRAVMEGTGRGPVTRVGCDPVRTQAATLRMPGSGAVRVEVDAGVAGGAATVAVAPLAEGFGVSDLLLARSVDEDGRGPVARDGLGIVPASRAVFAVGDPVYVVVEAYGLALAEGRTRYSVEAMLRPADRRGGLLGRVFGRGQGRGVAVRTEGEGDRPDETVAFFVDIRDQRPGAYTLSVTIRDEATGAAAASDRSIVLE